LFYKVYTTAADGTAEATDLRALGYFAHTFSIEIHGMSCNENSWGVYTLDVPIGLSHWYQWKWNHEESYAGKGYYRINTWVAGFGIWTEPVADTYSVFYIFIPMWFVMAVGALMAGWGVGPFYWRRRMRKPKGFPVEPVAV
jgi:hypothetical protein